MNTGKNRRRAENPCVRTEDRALRRPELPPWAIPGWPSANCFGEFNEVLDAVIVKGAERERVSSVSLKVMCAVESRRRIIAVNHQTSVRGKSAVLVLLLASIAVDTVLRVRVGINLIPESVVDRQHRSQCISLNVTFLRRM